MPRCVYMVPPSSSAPFSPSLPVHCPFRESQFLGQHPTLVFICRYFFWFFSCLPDCVMKTLSLSQFFVCVWVCVLVFFRYVPCALFFHYSYDPCASYLCVCVCLAWHWQLLLIVCTCNILPKLLPLALSLCIYIYINIYTYYIYILIYLNCRQFAWLVYFLSDKFAAGTLAKDDRL